MEKKTSSNLRLARRFRSRRAHARSVLRAGNLREARAKCSCYWKEPEKANFNHRTAGVRGFHAAIVQPDDRLIDFTCLAPIHLQQGDPGRQFKHFRGVRLLAVGNTSCAAGSMPFSATS